MVLKSKDEQLELEKKKEDLQDSIQTDIDRAWKGYVGGLAEEDDRGAFLLPDELPGPGAAPADVVWAIATATRRAYIGDLEPRARTRTRIGSFFSALRRIFKPAVRIQIRDYTPGILTGQLRMLLPQGRECVIEFNQEPGWRADVHISADPAPFEATFYYRSICMNPLRAAVMRGAEIDTSQVYFEPLDSERIQAILSDPRQDRLTENAVRRLRAEYRMYRNLLPGNPF